MNIVWWLFLFVQHFMKLSQRLLKLYGGQDFHSKNTKGHISLKDIHGYMIFLYRNYGIGITKRTWMIGHWRTDRRTLTISEGTLQYPATFCGGQLITKWHNSITVLTVWNTFDRLKILLHRDLWRTDSQMSRYSGGNNINGQIDGQTDYNVKVLYFPKRLEEHDK